MANLIVASFAFKEGFNTSLQLNAKAGSETTRMYLKNLYVSLVSCKEHNPKDRVMLCVNAPLSESDEAMFTDKGIEVRVVSFDCYVIDIRFSWALAFYKICVLKTLVDEGKYDRYVILDADTYITDSFEDLWKESDFGVILYPLGHTYSHPDRDTIRKDFVKLYDTEAGARPITHYGGEFVAGNRESLARYIAICDRVFERMKEIDFDIAANAGDETVWSVAAALSNEVIIPATPYIFRFWTEEFYLVSTVTVSNPVCIWHLPQEKRTGIIRLYDYYIKHQAFPKVSKAIKMLGMRKPVRPMNFYTFANKVKGKLGK